MIINIIGPIGAGKSTISKELAYRLKLRYIPEVAENDVKFFRLLNKRNRTQTSEDKKEFQFYTFEQAYARQHGATYAVIDTPCSQHMLMADCSLDDNDYIEYTSYYYSYTVNLPKAINIVIKPSFADTVGRIMQRGRKEEQLTKDEIEFYQKFYDCLFVDERYPADAVVVDASDDVDSVVDRIIAVLHDKIGDWLREHLSK